LPFLFIEILFLLVHFSAASHRSSLIDSDPNNHSLPQEYPNTLTHTTGNPIRGEKAAHDLASSWCSEYRRSDPERLAALETPEMEIVDRFGDWHHLIGLNAREHFWKDGFDMTSRKRLCFRVLRSAYSSHRTERRDCSKDGLLR